ncbi:MAG TPA: hypothetical protein VHT71_01680 [Methylomirabilota bacterium]|nr:hypothetical protein [Methylomirabilota bacterium]
MSATALKLWGVETIVLLALYFVWAPQSWKHPVPEWAEGAWRSWAATLSSTLATTSYAGLAPLLGCVLIAGLAVAVTALMRRR